MTLQSIYCSELVTIEEAHRLFDTLFKDVDGSSLSQKGRARLNTGTKSFMYGEVLFKSIVEILALINPKPNTVFYDLGSGTGKAVLSAMLTFPFSKLKGIEFISELHESSQQTYDELLTYFNKNNPHTKPRNEVSFTCEDFLKIDFSDADVVFMNSTCFDATLMAHLSQRLSILKRGAHVISFTKFINTADYELIYTGLHPMTWGSPTVYIQRRV